LADMTRDDKQLKRTVALLASRPSAVDYVRRIGRLYLWRVPSPQVIEPTISPPHHLAAILRPAVRKSRGGVVLRFCFKQARLLDRR
jgi:hypothetical protein